MNFNFFELEFIETPPENSHVHLIYADDTTLLLGSLDQLPHAEEAIQKWCRASGMRENYKKREGLGMGRYRNDKKPELPPNIKWIEEGNWAVSLGVPVGNDLDTEAWWKQKLKAVRKHTSRWVGLFRSSYFGRNLIVSSSSVGRVPTTCGATRERMQKGLKS